MLRSDASFKARSPKGGLLKTLQDRRLVAAYRLQSLAISPGSFRVSGFVHFSKASRPCRSGQKAELNHLRRLVSGSSRKEYSGCLKILQPSC